MAQVPTADPRLPDPPPSAPPTPPGTERGAAPRPVPPPAATSRRMSRQARQDTAPELALRRELHRLGLRYRVGYPVVGLRRRTIDVAFTRARLAVFVDGCFWHSCPEHATRPRTNGAWWQEKLARNVERDRQTDEHLREAGWRVLRLWEHVGVAEGARAVLEALGRESPAPTCPIRPSDPPAPTCPIRPSDPPAPTSAIRPSDPPAPTCPIRPSDPPAPTSAIRPSDPPASLAR